MKCYLCGKDIEGSYIIRSDSNKYYCSEICKELGEIINQGDTEL
jgi:ribosomal protein L24E